VIETTAANKLSRESVGAGGAAAGD